ncbi:MAG: hypothetical protein QXI07_08955 [Pyrobaculum sp.]
MFELVYTAGAAWLAVILAYRYAARIPLWSLPVGGVAVALGFIALYPWISSFFSLRPLQDLQAFEQSRLCIQNTIGAVATHVSFAADVIFTVAAILALFTLGLSYAIATLVVEALIDAVATFTNGMLVYLGFAESILGTLAMVVRLAPAFSALAAPLLATFVPDRRGAAAAAVVAALPIALTAPFMLAPPLEPLQCTLAEQPIFKKSADVLLSSNAPLLWVFNGTALLSDRPVANITAVYGAAKEVRARIPAGNYSVYAVWSFVVVFAKNYTMTSSPITYTGVSIANHTAYLPDLSILFMVNASLPYQYIDGWTFAVNERPNATEREGEQVVYEYYIKYYCHGYASDCPGVSKSVSALGQIAGVEVVVIEATNMDYSYSTSISNVTQIDERTWEAICTIGKIPGGNCLPYSRTNASYAYVVAWSTPVYECDGNGTCWEVPADHNFAAKILFKARYTPPPLLAGMKYNEYTTYGITKRLFGNMSLLQIVLMAFNPTALAARFAANLANYFFFEPLGWITGKLIPYLIALIFAQVAVLGGVAGIALLLGSGGVYLRWLSPDILAKWRWGYDPIRTTMSAGIRVTKTLGRGSGVMQPTATEAAREVVRDVVKEAAKHASMRLLATAAALRAAYTIYYGEWYFWPAYLAGAGILYRHFRKTDFTMSRLQAAARAAFHTFIPAGHELAQRIDSFIYWARMAAHLRADAFAALAARELHKAYQENLELTGSRLLAAELTYYYLRPVSATEAAYYIMFVRWSHELKDVKYFYPLLSELSRKTGSAEEELARRWLSLYGYDYDRLREALRRLGLDPTPQTVVMLPKLKDFSEAAAQRLLEAGEYKLAAAFAWTEAVRRFEEKYGVRLEDLGNNSEAAWRRYVAAVLREEWEPLRRGLPSIAEYAQAEEALRWFAESVVLQGGRPHLKMGDLLVPLDKAVLAYPDVHERLYSLVEGIIPEEVFYAAVSKPETALALYQIASELPPLEGLAERWAKLGDPDKMVEEAEKLVELGRHDLAARLRDAAELAAAARAAHALSLPAEPSPRDLAELAHMGLTEEQAKFVLERYGSYAADWLRDAEPLAEGEEPSRLAEHLARALFYREDAEAAARELEEVLGWRPTEEQVRAVAELYLKEELNAASLDHEALAEKFAEHIERRGWAEVPPEVADFVEGYKLVPAGESYIALREDYAEAVERALREVKEAGAAVVEDPVVAMALARMGYELEPYALGKWVAHEAPRAEEAAKPQYAEEARELPQVKEVERYMIEAAAERPAAEAGGFPQVGQHMVEAATEEPVAEAERRAAEAEEGGVEPPHAAGEAALSWTAEESAGAGGQPERGAEEWEQAGPRPLEEVRAVWTPDESKVMRIAEKLMELAAEQGVFMPEEEAKRWAREHGADALNAWAEEHAGEKYGEWARKYVEEAGWKALETLRHYEEAEREAARIGVDLPREELLKLAEKYGEEAAERLKDYAAEKIAKELKADFGEVRELIDRYGVDEALRRLREGRK